MDEFEGLEIEVKPAPKLSYTDMFWTACLLVCYFLLVKDIILG